MERLADNNEDTWVGNWEIINSTADYSSVSRHTVYSGGCTEGGGTTRNMCTDAQRATLERCVEDFHRRFPDTRTVGHSELTAKTCPGFGVQTWLESIGIDR